MSAGMLRTVVRGARIPRQGSAYSACAREAPVGSAGLGALFWPTKVIADKVARIHFEITAFFWDVVLAALIVTLVH